jgi:hypothetical protein
VEGGEPPVHSTIVDHETRNASTSRDRGSAERGKGQRPFGDPFIAEAVGDLQEAWMRHADTVLDDEPLVAEVSVASIANFQSI